LDGLLGHDGVLLGLLHSRRLLLLLLLDLLLTLLCGAHGRDPLALGQPGREVLDSRDGFFLHALVFAKHDLKRCGRLLRRRGKRRGCVGGGGGWGWRGNRRWGGHRRWGRWNSGLGRLHRRGMPHDRGRRTYRGCARRALGRCRL
jgi:hypothetical protein